MSLRGSEGERRRRPCLRDGVAVASATQAWQSREYQHCPESHGIATLSLAMTALFFFFLNQSLNILRQHIRLHIHLRSHLQRMKVRIFPGMRNDSNLDLARLIIQ